MPLPDTPHTGAAADTLKVELPSTNTQQTTDDDIGAQNIAERTPSSAKETDELAKLVAGAQVFVQVLKAKYGTSDSLAASYAHHYDIISAGWAQHDRRRIRRDDPRVPSSPPVSGDESDGSE